MVTVEIGHKGGLVNEYIVNGMLGAFLFAALAAFWQFAVKSRERNP